MRALTASRGGNCADAAPAASTKAADTYMAADLMSRSDRRTERHAAVARWVAPWNCWAVQKSAAPTFRRHPDRAPISELPRETPLQPAPFLRARAPRRIPFHARAAARWTRG